MQVTLGHGNRNTVAIIEKVNYKPELMHLLDVDGTYVVDGDEVFYFNKDGSPSPYCGNAMRVLGLYTKGKSLKSGGIVFQTTGESPVTVGYSLLNRPPSTINSCGIDWTIYELPNQHAVAEGTIDKSLLRLAQEEVGMNMTLYEKDPYGSVFARTLEKGAGFTLSCASAATAVALDLNGTEAPSDTTVRNMGGWIKVDITPTSSPMLIVTQTGPAEITGELVLSL